ncbi:MAG TPA: hypothetical protein PKO33_10670, partial [Pyrinomonadaceae bacterium]|nr:hypothetical protein [Pyrinomonadaceae bacterium]
NSLGGPAKTRNVAGITNADWFITNGGDGFRAQVDPTDPNTIYAESQNGGLVRFDKRTGERVDIAPIEGDGVESQRYNWDSPFIISPHSNTRIYFAGHKLFKSDNRGDDWKAISGDLSRGIDRNTLPVMGKVWGPDAIAKHQSTALWGNASAISESPKKQGLIYVGTDDGLIQVTENDGASWRKVDKIAGIPELSYVTRVAASQHDTNTVYALFNNHQNGDFKPYIVKSTDAGKTWVSITSNLPQRGSLYGFAEDPVNPNLLFVGTEFGMFFSVDGGGKWIQMKGNLPTIAVRDIAIQKSEDDLVIATFGRGIYVLDDYSALRQIKAETVKQQSALFPVRDALMYVRSNSQFTGFQGASFFTAPNPPYGATFTYFLKEAPKTMKQKRQEAEREAEKKKQAFKYPSIQELRAESEEEPPALILTVTDADGKIVRRLSAPAAAGVNRAVWDMRYVAPSIAATPPTPAPTEGGRPGPQGPLVMPGKYSVSMALRVNGVVTALPGAQSFNIVVEGREKMTPDEIASLSAFQKRVFEVQRAVSAASDAATTAKARIALLKRAAQEAPAENARLLETSSALNAEVDSILHALRGNRPDSEIPPPSIAGRISNVAGTIRLSTIRPTQTQTDQLALVESLFNPVLARLKKLVETDIPAFEKQLEAAGAPLTPGRLP